MLEFMFCHHEIKFASTICRKGYIDLRQ